MGSYLIIELLIVLLKIEDKKIVVKKNLELKI